MCFKFGTPVGHFETYFCLKFGDVQAEFEGVMNDYIAKNPSKSLVVPTE